MPTKHLFLIPLIPQFGYVKGQFCQEDPSATIAGIVSAGPRQTIFGTCGFIAANPSYIPEVCALDPRSVAEQLSPASLCQQTCGTGSSPEVSTTYVLGLQLKDNGEPLLYDTFTCGDLSQLDRSLIEFACSIDVSIWDDFDASVVCCDTCPSPLPQCLQWDLLGQDIDGDAPSDYMGESVALSSDGKTVATGANRHDGNGISDTGLVRVLNYDVGSMQWIQTGQDLFGSASGDNAGSSVALSSDGKTVAVGAMFADLLPDYSNGQVQIYVQDEGTKQWEQIGKFDGENAFDNLGESVDLSSDGNTVAMGASGASSYAGHVQVYSYAGSGQWIQKGSYINGEFGNDASGSSVSLSSDGNTIAIGAYKNGAKGFRTGHVRVYIYDNSKWNKIGQDIDGEAAGDESGYSVDLSADGTIVAIGAPNNEGNGYRAGHVRVYRFESDQWKQMGQDLDGEFINDFCGQSVALSSDGNTVAVGAAINDGDYYEESVNTGHVRVHNYDEELSIWVQIGDDIDGEAAADWLGESVAMSDNGRIVAAGAIFNDGGGSSSGHVRVFGC